MNIKICLVHITVCLLNYWAYPLEILTHNNDVYSYIFKHSLQPHKLRDQWKSRHKVPPRPDSDWGLKRRLHPPAPPPHQPITHTHEWLPHTCATVYLPNYPHSGCLKNSSFVFCIYYTTVQTSRDKLVLAVTLNRP